MPRLDPIEGLTLAPLRRLVTSLEHLVDTNLWARVLVGMLGGILLGVLLGPDAGLVSASYAVPIAHWLALPGLLFLALVQMIVVPLVFASVVRGLAAGDNVAQLRQLGLRGAAFFIVTTALATVVGLALGSWIAPGRFVDSGSLQASLVVPDSVAAATDAVAVPTLQPGPEMLIGLLPTNPLASMVGGEMLQVILFAFIVGIALVNLPTDKSAPLFDLLGSLQEVSMTVVSWAMRLAPFAVFGLMTRLTSTVGLDVLAGMSIYMLTVLLGLGIMLGLFVALAAVFARIGPRRYLSSIRDVFLLAFSTSSSAAVMPLSIETAEDRLGVAPSTARFLIPLGATINMNGTALYQGVATVFLAQVFAIDLTMGGLAIVVATAVSASIGSPATPGAGIVILAMVLEGVGIPTTGIALILGVDRILDMSRTAVNVTGDLTACVVIQSLAGAPEPADAPGPIATDTA